jgi:hypothetical protein
MDDERWHDAPITFPGMTWYEPATDTLGHATGLPAPDDPEERAALDQQQAERQARGIGFAP